MDCPICSSKKLSLHFNEIREGKENIINCNFCDILFLENFVDLDYSKTYFSQTLNSSWSLEKSLKNRSKSLKRFSDILLKEILNISAKKILEIGSGLCPVYFNLKDKLLEEKIDYAYIEKNKEYNNYTKKIFNECRQYQDIDEVYEEYDLIFAVHFLEHLTEPVKFLNKLKHKQKKSIFIFFLPNRSDIYSASLSHDKLNKYNKFMFHRAHPFYYNQKSISALMKTSGYQILELYTVQEYSISNFFSWYHNGIPSKNILDGQKSPKNFNSINNFFIKTVENNGLGSSLLTICKPL